MIKETFLSNKGYTHNYYGVFYKFVPEQDHGDPYWKLSNREDELGNTLMVNAFKCSLAQAYEIWAIEARNIIFNESLKKLQTDYKKYHDKETDTMRFNGFYS